MKRRWRFGNYDLKYNPKAYNGNMSSSGDIAMTANGVVSSNNLYYQEDAKFVFQIYDKPTSLTQSLRTYAGSYYNSISEDVNTSNLTVLRKGTNLYDVINKSGTIITSAKSVNLDAGSIVSSIVRINSSNVACMFPTGNLIICGDNGVQISKYTYTDQDVKDSISITWDNGTFLYLLNKFGKIFKVDRTTGTLTTQYTFADFASNKSSAKSSYAGIHFTSSGYLGVVNGNRIIYFNMSYDVIHSIEVPVVISDISSGLSSGSYYVATDTRICGFVPNMSAIEVDRVRSQLSNGAITIIDENNISKALFIKQMSVERIRNMQESRYDIGISGQII